MVEISKAVYYLALKHKRSPGVNLFLTINQYICIQMANLMSLTCPKYVNPLIISPINAF